MGLGTTVAVERHRRPYLYGSAELPSAADAASSTGSSSSGVSVALLLAAVIDCSRNFLSFAIVQPDSFDRANLPGSRWLSAVLHWFSLGADVIWPMPTESSGYCDFLAVGRHLRPYP